jgi:hypothetical protein
MSAAMAYARSGDHVVVVHADVAPSDAEWDLYVADGIRWMPELRGFLVVSDGGGPNSRQRRQMERSLAVVRDQPRIALVSSSLLGRGIGVAVSLFNANLRAFRPDDLTSALEYLRVSPFARPAVLAELERLRHELRR